MNDALEPAAPVSAAPEPAAIALKLRRRLLPWYRKHRRDLPWRRTRDPYAILVSEVMLQQTTVRTAEPFYLQFMERFPNALALARSRQEQVLSAWSGLGYYGRARNLRLAARSIVRDHAGRVPAEESAIRALPGVGAYTAGAVLSIAFDKPCPALDGNVSRVLSRIFAVPGQSRSPAVARRLWTIARALLPSSGAGEHNQALMELGALVCSPAAPQCRICPVSRFCAAHDAGRETEYPAKSARKGAVNEQHAAGLALSRGKVLIRRREPSGLLAGMWELPTVRLDGATDPREALESFLATFSCRGARAGRLLAEVRHTVLSRRIALAVFEIAGIRVETNSGLRWAAPSSSLALTGATRKALRALALLED